MSKNVTSYTLLDVLVEVYSVNSASHTSISLHLTSIMQSIMSRRAKLTFTRSATVTGTSHFYHISWFTYWDTQSVFLWSEWPNGL